MPSLPAKTRRLVLPPVNDGQQLLFSFDDVFPKDQWQAEAEKLLDARRRGETIVVVPDGMHVHIRDGAGREWCPIEPRRGRGQPRKRPAGTWEDDDLFDVVEGILGDHDQRADSGTEIRDALYRVGREFLGSELFTKEREIILQSFALKAVTKRVGSDEIVRQLRVWRHDLTDPAVRKMQLPRKPKPVAHDFSTLVLKYGPERPLLTVDGRPVTDEDGRPVLVRPPICNEEGRPVRWVPDEHGQPDRPHVEGEPLPRRRVKTVRPHVTMIFG